MRRAQSYRRASCILGFLCAFATAIPGETLHPRYGKVIDLQIKAGVMSLTVERDAVIPKLEPRGLGSQWRMNWENHLTRQEADDLVLIDDGGGVAAFYAIPNRPNLYAGLAGDIVQFSESGTAERRWSGIRDSYDRLGRLTERNYGNGSRFLISYNVQDRLTRVEGPRQATLDFTYDSNGRVSRVTASTGEFVEYTYQGDALATASVNGAARTSYAYDSRGALTRIDDPVDGPTVVSYDAQFRVTGYRYADGQSQRYEYDDAQRIERRIDAMGAISTTQHSADGKQIDTVAPTGLKTSVKYDDLGRTVGITAHGVQGTTIAYDARGRMTAVQSGPGSATRYEYDQASGRLSAVVYPDGGREQIEYDTAGRIIGIRIGNRQISTYTHSPDGTLASAQESGGRMMRYQYDAQGRVTSVTDAANGVTRYEYDRRGNVVAVTNPLGGIIRTAYDSENRPVSETSPTGAVTHFKYDVAGRLVAVVLPGGATRKMGYDVRGRRASLTDEAGRTTTYTYDPEGRLAKTVDHAGRETTYRHDRAGNLVEAVSHTGHVIRLERDAAGRLMTTTSTGQPTVNYTYNRQGDVMAVAMSDGRRSAWELDRAGRPARISGSRGTVAYEYDQFGHQSARTDANGARTSYTYSALGDLSQIAMPAGNVARYGYDAAGRVNSAERAGGHPASITYDAMGNPVSVTKPSGGRIRIERDVGGRVTATWDELNQVTRYTYDAAGRISEKALPGNVRIRYTRDGLGRATEVDDGKFSVRYGYTATGQVSRVEYPAIRQIVAYDYDTRGRRVRMSHGNTTVSYSYNTANQIIGLTFGGSTIAFGYDASGRLTSIAYPNGVTAGRTFGGNGELSAITYRGPSNQDIAAWTYRYSTAGARIERIGSGAARYEFDAAGQLIAEITGTDQSRYTYAPGGNRTSASHRGVNETYRYTQSDLLQQAGTKSYAYDAAGRVTAIQNGPASTKFTYGPHGYLASAVKDSLAIAFEYAPTGQRVKRQAAAKTQWFVHDGSDVVLELDANLRPVATFVHGPGIDFPLAMIRGGQAYFYHPDEVGSVRHISDSAGNVVGSYEYDAFGMPLQTSAQIENPYRFTGREVEPDLGLYYLRARYYDYATGRFLQPDPAWSFKDDPLDLNPYIYARNNPVAFSDPTGAVASPTFGGSGLGPSDLAAWSTEDLLLLVDHENPAGDWFEQMDMAKDILSKRGVLEPPPSDVVGAEIRRLKVFRDHAQADLDRVQQSTGGTEAWRANEAKNLQNEIAGFDERIKLKVQTRFVTGDAPTPGNPSVQPRQPTLVIAQSSSPKGNTQAVNVPEQAAAPPARPPSLDRSPGGVLPEGGGAGGAVIRGGRSAGAGGGSRGAGAGPAQLTSDRLQRLNSPPEGVILEGRKVGNKWLFDSKKTTGSGAGGRVATNILLLGLALAQCKAEGFSDEACALRMASGLAIGTAVTKLVGAQIAQKLGVGLAVVSTSIQVAKADVELIRIALDGAREKVERIERQRQQTANAAEANRSNLLSQMNLLRREVSRVEDIRRKLETRLRSIDDSLSEAEYKNARGVPDLLQNLKGTFDAARAACVIVKTGRQNLSSNSVTVDTLVGSLLTQIPVSSNLAKRCGSPADLQAAQAAYDLAFKLSADLRATRSNARQQFRSISDYWPRGELGIDQVRLAADLERQLIEKMTSGNTATTDAAAALATVRTAIAAYTPDALSVRRRVENWKGGLNILDFEEPLRGEIIELGFSAVDLETIDPPLPSLEEKLAAVQQSLRDAAKAVTDSRALLAGYRNDIAACGAQGVGDDRTPKREQRLLDRIEGSVDSISGAVTAANLDGLLNACRQKLNDRPISAMPPPRPAVTAGGAMPPPPAPAPLVLPPIPDERPPGVMPPPPARTAPPARAPGTTSSSGEMPPPPGRQGNAEGGTVPPPPVGTQAGTRPAARPGPGEMGDLLGSNRGQPAPPAPTGSGQNVVCNGGITAAPNSGYAGDRFVVTVSIPPPPNIVKVLVRSTRLAETELTKSGPGTFSRGFRFSEGRTGSVPITFDALDENGRHVCSQTISVQSRGLKPQ